MPAGRRREWPLAAVLTWRFCLVTLIPLLALSIGYLVFVTPGVMKSIEDRHDSFASGVVSQTEQYFATATHELATLQRLLGAGVRVGGQLDGLLDAYASSSDFYESISLLDTNRRIIAIGLPATLRGLRSNHIGLDLSARDVFIRKAQASRKPVWSNSMLSPISGRLTVAVAVPVGDLTLVGEVALTPLPALVTKLTERTPLMVMILDRDNQLVAHSQGAYANQQLNLGNLSVVRARSNGTAGQPHEFDFDGRSWIGSARSVPGPDWLVVVAESQQSAYSQIRGFWWRLGIGFALAMVAALVAAIWSARLLARLFRPYTEQAGAIEGGRYDLPQPDSGVAELNRVGDSLQHMGQAIQDREHAMQQAQAALHQLNATLEERVDERTDELTRANEELVQTLRTLQDTQDQLLRADKLSALGSMVAGIAHELNTPIGNSLLAATTQEEHNQEFERQLAEGPLRRSILDRFLATHRQATDILLRNLGRAGELIKSFKQVAVDQTSSQRRNFRIDEVVSEILLSLSPTLRKTPYRIETDVAPELWMDSFPGPLGQVLTNLINNAIVHAFEDRDHGTIRIAAHWLHARDSIAITVTDNGRGIPADHLPRVFDPFFTTKLGRGGSGLGLNLAHNLVTGTLGGRIDVSSIEGRQTTFSIEVPATAPGTANEDNR